MYMTTKKYNNLSNEEREIAKEFFKDYGDNYRNIKISRNECSSANPILQQVSIAYIRLGDRVFVGHDRDSLFSRIFGDNPIPQETSDVFGQEYDFLEFAFWEDA